MKTRNKIKLGLGALLSLLLLVGFILPGHRALAVSATSAQDVLNCDKNLRFASLAEIDCTFTASAGGSQTIRFIDSNPTDSGSTHAYKMNYSQQGNFFCENGSVTTSTNDNGAFNRYYPLGVTHKGDGPLNMSDAGNSIKLVLDEGYADQSTGQCRYPKGYNKDSLPNVTITGAATADISKVMQFGGGGTTQTDNQAAGTTIGPLSGVTNGDTNKTYGLVGGYTYNSNTVAYTLNFSQGTCGGEVVLANISNKTANRYVLKSGTQSLSSEPALLDFLNKQNTHGCNIDSSSTNFGLGGSFGLLGTPPTVATIKNAQPAGATNTSGSDSQNSSNTCEDKANGFSLSWALCPVLDAASGVSNWLLTVFEDQLSFRVSDLNTQSPGADNGYSQTKAAWAIIRDIASSLLVIFMLVMVLSQAISWGPFDAYTIKKLMPKLVIAVIFMQISWDVFAWVVGIVDDIGHGLANLMYLPFGGPSNMTLFKLLGNAHIGTGTLFALDYVALIGGGFLVLKTAVLPMMMGMATAAFLALAAGLFALVFRKILIIMLLILSPLALVAWILPGTQSYWKMWRENFTKALSMFPIAVVIIAAGRIFAKVAGSQNDSEVLNMIFIFVGFFGPLFILPKTFKWGGQAMQMAGNGIMKARDKVNEYPKKYFADKQQSLAQQLRGNAAKASRDYDEASPERRRQMLAQYMRNPKRWGSLAQLTAGNLRSGVWDPYYKMLKVANDEHLGEEQQTAQKAKSYNDYLENHHKQSAAEQTLAKRVSEEVGEGEEVREKLYDKDGNFLGYKVDMEEDGEGKLDVEKSRFGEGVREEDLPAEAFKDGKVDSDNYELDEATGLYHKLKAREVDADEATLNGSLKAGYVEQDGKYYKVSTFGKDVAVNDDGDVRAGYKYDEGLGAYVRNRRYTQAEIDALVDAKVATPQEFKLAGDGEGFIRMKARQLQADEVYKVKEYEYVRDTSQPDGIARDANGNKVIATDEKGNRVVKEFETENGKRVIKDKGYAEDDFTDIGNGKYTRYKRTRATKDDFLQDIVYGRERFEYVNHRGERISIDSFKHNKGLILAAAKRMAELAGGTNLRHIKNLHNMIDDDRFKDVSKAEWREFMNDNRDLLLNKLTSMYKGTASTADASPDGIAEMHGVEIEDMLAKLSQGVRRAQTDDERDSAKARLDNFLANYLAAAENPNLRGRMEAGGTRAMLAFLAKTHDERGNLIDPHMAQIQHEILYGEGGIDSDEQDGRAVIGLPTMDLKVADQVNKKTRAMLLAQLRKSAKGGFESFDQARKAQEAAAKSTNGNGSNEPGGNPPDSNPPNPGGNPPTPGGVPPRGGPGAPASMYDDGFGARGPAQVITPEQARAEDYAQTLRIQGGAANPTAEVDLKLNHRSIREMGRAVGESVGDALEHSTLDVRSVGGEPQSVRLEPGSTPPAGNTIFMPSGEARPVPPAEPNTTSPAEPRSNITTPNSPDFRPPNPTDLPRG